MIGRRHFLCSLASAAQSILADRAFCNTGTDFDHALAAALTSNMDAIARAAADREGQDFTAAYYAARPLLGRPAPSNQPISDRAIKLIIGFEVISGAYYDKRLQSPTWPGGSSGVTVGCGYDIGYTKKEWFTADWKDILDDQAISTLAGACGVRGATAGALTKSLKAIQVPWRLAEQQFRERELKMFIAETMDQLPNAEKLSPDSLGALVSLVYNRGPSFKAVGPRYEDMRAIRRHMVTQAFSEIPGDMRRMKALWIGKGQDGLVLRRELEARLFQAGLS